MIHWCGDETQMVQNLLPQLFMLVQVYVGQLSASSLGRAVRALLA